MAFTQYATPIDHTGDAGFRAWGLELSTALQAAGLVKTSDTGQINFTTVTRPGLNLPGGYEIYRLNDSLNGSRPVYIKIEYGTGQAAGIAALWVTTGSASNGAGTLTGFLTTRGTFTVTGSTILSTVTNYTTSICVTDGFFGLAFKMGAQAISNNSLGFLAICRSCNDLGALTTDWLAVYRMNTSTSANLLVETMDYVGNTLYTINDSSFSTITGNVSSSLVGMDIQVYKHFVVTPRVRPVFQLFSMINTEAGSNNTFTTASVGAVTHTYLTLGPNVSRASVNQASATIAMLWE